MLKKPENYESIELREFDFVPLELGGHKGIIKKVEEYTSNYSGNTSLRVAVDTDKNDKQPSYFQDQYNKDTRPDKKWNNGAIKYVSLKDDENCVRMLKAFITAVENSNTGFKYDWSKDIVQLVGKKIGLVFGLEEYENDKKEIKTATKLTQFRSVDKTDTVKIPKVKLITGVFVDYDEYIARKTNTKPADDNDIFATITEYVGENDENDIEL